jgi:hypothetical protein
MPGLISPELDVLDERPIFEEPLGVGEGASVTTQPPPAIAAVDLHVERHHRAVAADPVHVDPFEIVLAARVHRVDVEMHVVARPVFERQHRADPLLGSELVGRPASRGINPLLICWVVRPGFCASRKASLMTVPGIRPLPALFGTTPGMVQLPPPVGLQGGGRAEALRGRRGSCWTAIRCRSHC